MTCGCLSEPPEFDLPQPPDPSLVWSFLAESGESLLHYQKIRLQTCAYNPLFGFLGRDDIYLPVLLCICFIVVTIGCLVSACVYRRRRRKEGQKKCLTSSVNTSKTNSGSDDTSGGVATHWSSSFNSAINLAMPSVEYSGGGPLGQSKLVTKIYGSSSSNNLFHAQPVLATANTKQGALIRTLPKRTLPHLQGIRLQSQFPSQCCVHHHPTTFTEHLTYCTLGSQMQPQYEEIGSIYHQAHYAANPICCESTPHGLLQRHDSETIFEDLSENLRRQERRPAPTEKPPAPPSLNYSRQYQQVHVGQRSANHGHQSNSDSSITDELCSASDVELEAQLGIPLPMEVVQTRQQSANDLMGRESGYGTGSKAKLANHWHSPPQLLRVGSSVRSSPNSGNSSQHNSPPSSNAIIPPVRLLKSNNNQESVRQNMTYV